VRIRILRTPFPSFAQSPYMGEAASSRNVEHDAAD